MAEQKHVRFAELLTLHLNNKVKKKFQSGSTLTPVVLREIRDVVQDTVREVFTKSSHTLSAESINWIANRYFKSIQLGTSDGNVSIHELVVINEYKLADLSYHDIQLMRNLFDQTDMSVDLNEEFRRRSTS